MNWPQPPQQIFLALEPVDIRQGIDKLSQRLAYTLGTSPCNGNAYAFRNRSGNRIKLLLWDGTGVWMCVRRLHRGRFTWPQSQDTLFLMNSNDWHWLTTGIDWRRLSAQTQAAWQV